MPPHSEEREPIGTDVFTHLAGEFRPKKLAPFLLR